MATSGFSRKKILTSLTMALENLSDPWITRLTALAKAFPIRSDLGKPLTALGALLGTLSHRDSRAAFPVLAERGGCTLTNSFRGSTMIADRKIYEF